MIHLRKKVAMQVTNSKKSLRLTYLKVHCYAAIINYKVQHFRCMASPEYQVIAS